MKKNIYLSFVIFMVVSILTIIFVQGYWIYFAWKNKESEFSLAVQQSLQIVAKEVEERELSDYIARYNNLIDSIGTPDQSDFLNIFLFLDEDEPNNLISYFTYGLLKEQYNVTPYLNPQLGVVSNVADYKSVRNTTIVNKNDVFDREKSLISSIERINTVERMNIYDQTKRDAFIEYSSKLPVHRRVSVEELNFLLNRELLDKDIETDYEFGVYNDGLATKITSNNYVDELKGPRYSTPIFMNSEGVGMYDLVVTFPQKDAYVLSSIFGIGALTFLLTLFIVLVSTSALYQIIRQKKLSEIKTDFINNMSHEFKTPIATINLALDAISNPKSISSKSSINKYVGLIREENLRMLKQVENVLRISQLEKSKDPIIKKLIHLHPLIEEAIKHVKLLLESKNGKIELKNQADQDLFLGNANHFTNVIINILDNAIKYTDAEPQIFVQTWIDKQHLFLSIEDRGFGMSAATQKMIFEKFYRETSGDVHNIKGHGLGLAYVKKIMDLHQGQVEIKSKLGQGSIFTLSVNLESPQKT